MQQDPQPHALPESLPATNKDPRIFALHLDFKPVNIFIDRMSEEGFGYPKRYPTLRVADFGLSAYTCLEDPHNTEAAPRLDGMVDLEGLRWRGTEGYRSPVTSLLSSFILQLLTRQ